MIKHFRHKGLEDYFARNSTKRINAQLAGRIRRLLDRLDASLHPQDMNLPGYGLHELSGDRKGTWSVIVSGNWRITFRFIGEHAHDVNLEDYH